MDQQLEMSLKELFLVVGIATNCLDDERKERVFQWLCVEMERWVSEESLREVMQEYGYTKEESCNNCNETVLDWDFERDGNNIRCYKCEETCEHCGNATHFCESFCRKRT